jgi:hypothetical protein
VALGQESEAQQAAMTRLARFDQLRGGIEAQLMAGLANLSQAFLVKAEEQVATTNTAVMLTFDLTVGPAAPRCKLTCDKRTAGLGDTLLAMWFDTVVQPLTAHRRGRGMLHGVVQRGADRAPSPSSNRDRGGGTVCRAAAAVPRAAALMGRVKATLPTSASATMVAIPAPTTSIAAQEAADTSTTATTDTALEPKPTSHPLPTPSSCQRRHRYDHRQRMQTAHHQTVPALSMGGSSLTASSATTAMKYPRVVLLTSLIVASQAWHLRGSSGQR